MTKDITPDTIKIFLFKSLIGVKKSHRATIRGLGLRKMNSCSILVKTPEILGMINKVRYLIKLG
ncbi:LSU ribosomal protein L30P [Nitrosomonas ureae]|uniref:Large ribosomal subunit protein uL30 n=1 Tax=Nitrosomonas ureae TaxID=44577 RepID=A0A285C1H8_9PROT|nr:50S ribosomal protein L30 [Nitrosomonas ureae]SNX61424.1 LSU ribosomal protein L30P [Nitrosomonas ureae]